MKKFISLSLLTFTSLFADAELEGIKEQLKQQQYNTQQLKLQIARLEQKSTNTSASFSQNAYLPDLAFVLNMSALGRNVKNSAYESYAIPGFIDSGDAELPFNKDRGLNFNYAELALHSTVDPYFDAYAILHIHPDGLEVEEAYVETRSLPYGFLIKAGKMKSSFGRINSKHHHSWQFDSQPIIYEALFGPDAISDAGVKLQWVAPTDTYIMTGVEALQGTNDQSFGDPEKNNLYVGYIKSSIDIGDNLSILGGVSLAHGQNTTQNSTDVYGLDLTLREQLGSYSALIWQNEFLSRNKDLGTKTDDKQAGFYSEVIYQYNNNYSCGFRYDQITQNKTDLSTYKNSDNLLRYTAKLEYKPFPMSRLRLEYTNDQTKVIDGKRKDIDEVMLTLNVAAGAHGAHEY